MILIRYYISLYNYYNYIWFKDLLNLSNILVNCITLHTNEQQFYEKDLVSNQKWNFLLFLAKSFFISTEKSHKLQNVSMYRRRLSPFAAAGLKHSRHARWTMFQRNPPRSTWKPGHQTSLSALLAVLIRWTTSWHFCIASSPSGLGILATHVGLAGLDGEEEGAEGRIVFL